MRRTGQEARWSAWNRCAFAVLIGRCFVCAYGTIPYMSDSEALKRDIRKRLFLSVAHRADPSSHHGFRWCQCCRGRGEVCREYSDDSSRWAVFEVCSACGGEGAVEVEQTE